MEEHMEKVISDTFTEHGTNLEAMIYQKFRLSNAQKAASAENGIISILAESGMSITEAKGCLRFVELRLGTKAYIKS